jgi:hypothetical protein
MPNYLQNPFDQEIYDQLTLVGKEQGDYGSAEYSYRGTLGGYRMRIGHSVMDNSKVLTFFQNNKNWLTLYPTRTRKVFAGQNDDGEYYVFRFDGREVYVFKRKYEL